MAEIAAPPAREPDQPGEGGPRSDAGSAVFTAILWLIAAGFFAGGFQFSYPANLMPLIFGGAALLLLTHQGIQEAHAIRARRIGARDQAGMAGAGARAEAAALAWILGVAALLLLLGFMIGMTLGLVALIRIYLRESWLTAVAVPVGVILTLYVAFSVVLGVPLYPGLLEV